MIIRLIWTWCRTPVHFEGFEFQYKGTEVNLDIKNVYFFVYGISSPVPKQNFHVFGELELEVPDLQTRP